MLLLKDNLILVLPFLLFTLQHFVFLFLDFKDECSGEGTTICKRIEPYINRLQTQSPKNACMKT